MKRFHVHVAVDNLTQSTRFYSALFGVQPSVAKPDYAKWMLDDPRINFAISKRGGEPGINHLGFQVDSNDELAELQSRHDAAELSVFDEGNTQCCYAKSKKHWVTDPQGIAWEMYHSMGAVKTYHGGEDSADDAKTAATASACCAPDTSTAAPTTAKCSTACCPAPATV